MTDWRSYRPAIWTAMVGIAVMIVISPHYLGAFLLGLAIGIAIRIHQRERRRAAAAASASSSAARKRKRGDRSPPGKGRSR